MFKYIKKLFSNEPEEFVIEYDGYEYAIYRIIFVGAYIRKRIGSADTIDDARLAIKEYKIKSRLARKATEEL